MKSLIVFILCLLIIPTVLAVDLGEFEQNNIVELTQVCDNCTYVHLTTVQYPNSSVIDIGINMTKVRSTYNYSFSNTISIGDYIYTTCGDPDGIYTCQSVDFEITTTGDKVSLSNIIIVITFLLVAGMFLYIGSTFDKEKWMVKTAFHLCALLMGLLAINSGRIIASESLDLTTMGTSGLIIMVTIISFMFLYIFICATISAFKQIKYRNELRWDY